MPGSELEVSVGTVCCALGKPGKFERAGVLFEYDLNVFIELRRY